MSKYNEPYIINRILRLCVKPRSTEYIFHKLDGLDLKVAKDFLKKLELNDAIKFEKNLWVINEKIIDARLNLYPGESKLVLKKHMGYFDFLKVPHPLDFEWRNTSYSLDYLIQLIEEVNTTRDKVLLLGMPSLFATSIEKDIPHSVTLIDKNQPIIETLNKRCKQSRFKILNNNIFESKHYKQSQYYFVFMDPPWYSSFFKSFIWFGARCAELGGLVGISFPPLNTKDNTPSERMNWFEFAFSQGLILEKLYDRKLNYTMPFFEYNAYSFAGISDMSPFWRYGDLALFRKVKEASTRRPNKNIEMGQWQEVEKNTVRFRINLSNNNLPSTELTLEPLTKFEILPSISRGDRIRKKANVVTSGNRIFKVNDPQKLYEILNNLDINKNYGDDLIETQLQEIIKREKSEYEDYLEWLYHEMEKNNY